MKKNQTIDTLSAQKQYDIMRWYRTTRNSLCLLFAFLIITTGAQWYIYRQCKNSCTPCIPRSYAETINKQHAAHTTRTGTTKTIASERDKNGALLHAYASAIGAQTEAAPEIQLIDLRLTQQGLTAHYNIAHRSTVKECIALLKAQPTLKQVTFESIEQKNNAQTGTCTLHAQWQL